MYDRFRNTQMKRSRRSERTTITSISLRTFYGVQNVVSPEDANLTLTVTIYYISDQPIASPTSTTVQHLDLFLTARTVQECIGARKTLAPIEPWISYEAELSPAVRAQLAVARGPGRDAPIAANLVSRQIRNQVITSFRQSKRYPPQKIDFLHTRFAIRELLRGALLRDPKRLEQPVYTLATLPKELQVLLQKDAASLTVGEALRTNPDRLMSALMIPVESVRAIYAAIIGVSGEETDAGGPDRAESRIGHESWQEGCSFPELVVGDDRNRRCLIPQPNFIDENGNQIWLEGIGSECDAPGAVPIDNAPPPSTEENAGTLGAPSPLTPPPSRRDPGPARPLGDPASTTGTAAPSTTVTPPSAANAGRPPGAGTSDGRPLAQQYYDPLSQLREYDLTEQLIDAGIPPSQWDSALQAIVHNQPPPGMPHSYFGLDNRTLLDTLGDPVVIFTGQYSLAITDIEIPSRGFVLRLTRQYRSGEVYFGPWGYNWDHNYNCYLRELSNGGAAIWTGQLNEDVYTTAPSGFEPPMGVFRTLERLSADASGPDRYVVSDREGNRQIFFRQSSWPLSDRIPLMALEDAHGNRHDLTYDAEGRVARVTDHAGRFIQFGYGECALLETVVDHTGRSWRYDHDTDIEHLIAVTTPGTDEYPDGLTTRYEYDRDQDYPLLAHGLVRVIDPAGRLVIRNQYGSDPQSYNFGRITYQEFGDYVTVYDATQLQFPPRVPGVVNAPTWRVRGHRSGCIARLHLQPSRRSPRSSFSAGDRRNIPCRCGGIPVRHPRERDRTLGTEWTRRALHLRSRALRSARAREPAATRASGATDLRARVTGDHDVHVRANISPHQVLRGRGRTGHDMVLRLRGRNRGLR